MDGLRSLNAVEIARRVNAGELSALEVVEAHIAGLDEARALNAIITDCAEQAVARARNGLSGPLAGVPLLVKDLLDTAGTRTTYGSQIFADHVPEQTATAVALLERAGAVVIGKANLHELAWGTTSQNPFWGSVENPVLPGRVAGGSSGGNAAALAAGVSALGLGTDTAGSLRIPAACCGVVGFKPPHGRVPTTGCRPLSSTLDVVGPMARTVADCVRAYAVLTGAAEVEPRFEGLTIGILDRAPGMSPHEPGLPPAGAAVAEVEEWAIDLEALGARVSTSTLPDPEADLIPIFLAEAAASHHATFPARRAEYGPDTQHKWDVARRVGAADVAEARRALHRWRRRARDGALDVYVTPVLSIPVPQIDVWEPDVRVSMVANTRTFSFLGWPAIAIGNIQLAGPDERKVLSAALAWEAHHGPPPLPTG
jgi:aspartyl-tRNA(Asn)/glutamyl-tRNA(Gln) amidotransferase subunit A